VVELRLRTGTVIVATASVDVKKALQVFEPATERVPGPITPALMVLVDEVPVQPPGSVQV